jgi:hypothetical protein
MTASDGPDLMDQPLQQKLLKLELRLIDLVLMQVLLVVGLSWTGFVAPEGSTHVFLWVAGILLFYLPSAAVVILLSFSPRGLRRREVRRAVRSVSSYSQ